MTIITREEGLNHLYDNSITVEGGCREWQGPRTVGGYGNIGSNVYSKTWGIQGAHRLMFHLTTGHEFTSRNQQVCHTCDNPSCIEPRHLFVASPRENQLDCSAKNRRNLNALDAEKVRMIRALLAIQTAKQKIAALFGVSPTTISDIANGRTWRHVTI